MKYGTIYFVFIFHKLAIFGLFIKSLVKYTKEKNKMTGLFHDPYFFPLKDSGR